MDEQQNSNLPNRGASGQGVTVGAGLQESRLNTDLIDFLRKYGPFVLYALLVVVGGYAAINWFQQRQVQARDAAFVALNDAARAGSPDGLLEVASAHDGQGAVGELARLRAAMLLVESGRLGIAMNTPPEQRANPSEEFRLSESQAMEQLARAESLYREVLGRAGSRSDRYLVAQQARWGLATALSGQGKFAEAEAAIGEYRQAAERANWAGHVSVAEQRLALLADARSMGGLPSAESLPESNRAPLAASGPLPPATIRQTQQFPGGMPIPGLNDGSQGDGGGIDRVTDPELLRVLEEMRRNQMGGGQPAPSEPAEPAPGAPQNDPGR